MFDKSEISRLGLGLESVIRFPDMTGQDRLLFVFSDDVENVIAAVTLLSHSLSIPVSPFFLRRRELFRLSISPLSSLGCFHLAEWIQQRGSVLYGEDVRSEVVLPHWNMARLRYHLEDSIEFYRRQLFAALACGQPVQQACTTAMMELMLSVLLVNGSDAWAAGEIVAKFREIAGPELVAILDEWQSLNGNTQSRVEQGFDETGCRWIWLYERFMVALEAWADEHGPSCPERFECQGEKMVRAESALKSPPPRRSHPLNLPSLETRSERAAPYWAAIEAGMQELKRSSGVISVMLYGSVARSEVVPGESDILDAFVVLEDDCMSSWQRYLETSRVLVDSCGRMANRGIPFQPFKYTTLGDLQRRHPPMFLAEWLCGESSRTLLGEELRPYARCSDLGISFARSRLFTTSLVSRYVAQLLHEARNSERDLKVMQAALTSSIKIMPRLTCAARDIWVTGKAAIHLLPKMIPDANGNLFDALVHARITKPGLHQARELLRSTLQFSEEAAHCASAWLFGHDGVAGNSVSPARQDLLPTS